MVVVRTLQRSQSVVIVSLSRYQSMERMLLPEHKKYHELFHECCVGYVPLNHEQRNESRQADSRRSLIVDSSFWHGESHEEGDTSENTAHVCDRGQCILKQSFPSQESTMVGCRGPGLTDKKCSLALIVV